MLALVVVGEGKSVEVERDKFEAGPEGATVILLSE